MTKLTATLQSTSDPHIFIKNKIPDKHLKDAISIHLRQRRGQTVIEHQNLSIHQETDFLSEQ